MTPPTPPTYQPPGSRGVSLRDRPTVSVVVASRGPPVMLGRCLASLAEQAQRNDAEIVVVRAGPDVGGLQAEHPQVRFVTAEPGADQGSLRELGLTAASGDIVALLDDDCVAAEAWLDQLVLAGTGDNAAADDTRALRRTNAIDWATYLAAHREGGSAPDTGAETPDLFGESLLGAFVAASAPDAWEPLVHADRAPGSPPTGPASVRPTSVRHFCWNRFVHGREYAARQLRTSAGAGRWDGIAAACALPFRRTWPLARHAASKLSRPALLAVPLAFTVLCCWSLGEVLGYARSPRPARGP